MKAAATAVNQEPGIRPTLPPVFLIAFSGHRPSKAPGRSDAELEAVGARIEDVLSRLARRAADCGGEIHLASSLAAGADIVACETAMRMGIPIHLVLPMPWHEFLQTFTGVESWIPRAAAIAATAISVPECPSVRINPRHTLRVASTSRVDPDCFAEANTFLLDVADLLLTVSNGIPSSSIAGTTHLTQQAAALGIPHINLNPAAPGEAPPEIPPSFAAADCPSPSRTSILGKTT